MGINGNISTMSLAEVFQWLHSGQKNGTLHIKGKQRIVKEVYFQQGTISSAYSNDPAELLGQFLLSTSRISEQQLASALEAQKRDHVLLGKLLVKQKIITDEELFKILKAISEDIIYDLFLWKEGVFEFMDDVLPRREVPHLSLEITHLILEGAQREDEWARIRVCFPDEQAVIRPNIDNIANKLPLERQTAKLLSLVNGTRTLYEITRLAKSTKYHLFRSMLDLHEMKLIEVGSFRDQFILPHVQVRKNPVKEMLVNVENLMKQGKFNEAEQGIKKLETMAPNNMDVTKLKELIEQRKLETTAKAIIKPTAIPILKMDINSLTKMDFSAEEGFLVSRINGVWDVLSIIKVAPFPEADCLTIFKKFADDGVIAFK